MRDLFKGQGDGAFYAFDRDCSRRLENVSIVGFNPETDEFTIQLNSDTVEGKRGQLVVPDGNVSEAAVFDFVKRIGNCDIAVGIMGRHSFGPDIRAVVQLAWNSASQGSCAFLQEPRTACCTLPPS